MRILLCFAVAVKSNTDTVWFANKHCAMLGPCQGVRNAGTWTDPHQSSQRQVVLQKDLEHLWGKHHCGGLQWHTRYIKQLPTALGRAAMLKVLET